jgi:hypothetical protein
VNLYIYKLKFFNRPINSFYRYLKLFLLINFMKFKFYKI